MKTCSYCAGHGCGHCDQQGVLSESPRPRVASYPPGYNSIRQEMTDWKLAIPIEHPEMIVWGSSLVVAAFMVAAPRVVAGFAGLAGLGVSDDQYLAAEESFANHAYQFDHAVDCQGMRRRMKLMRAAWAASGYDSDIAKQLNMRSNQYLKECR